VITKEGSRETRSAWRGTFFLLVLGDQEMLTEEDRRGGPHDMSDEQEEEGDDADDAGNDIRIAFNI